MTPDNAVAGNRTVPQFSTGLKLFVRLEVAVIGGFATTVGMVPAALYFSHHPFVIPVVFAAALAAALVAAFQIKPTNLIPPPTFEVLAAALSAISQGTIISIAILVMFGIFNGLFWLVNAALGFFGSSIPAATTEYLHYAVMVFGGLAILGSSGSTVKSLWQMLYPPVAGYSTPFHGLVRSRYGKPILIAGSVAVVAFVLLAKAYPLTSYRWLGYMGANYLLLMSTITAWETARKKVAPRVFTTSEEAVGAILKAMDFQLIEQPRTGFAGIDPYLAELDFAALHGTRTFAIMVQDDTSGPQVPSPVQTTEQSHGTYPRSDFECVSQVSMASHALEEGSKRLGAELAAVEPVLVLVARDDSDTLQSFAPSQGVTVIRIPDAAALQPEKNDSAQLKEIGQRLFSLLLADRAERPAQASTLESPGTGAAAAGTAGS
jgi:hypothetical protein